MVSWGRSVGDENLMPMLAWTGSVVSILGNYSSGIIPVESFRRDFTWSYSIISRHYSGISPSLSFGTGKKNNLLLSGGSCAV